MAKAKAARDRAHEAWKKAHKAWMAGTKKHLEKTELDIDYLSKSIEIDSAHRVHKRTTARYLKSMLKAAIEKVPESNILHNDLKALEKTLSRSD